MRTALLILLLSAPPLLGAWCVGTGAGECAEVLGQGSERAPGQEPTR
jgi:hypothetical protein